MAQPARIMSYITFLTHVCVCFGTIEVLSDFGSSSFENIHTRKDQCTHTPIFEYLIGLEALNR